MTRASIFATSLVALMTASCGTPAPPAVPESRSEFSADRIRAHVAFLADDSLEGRESGTRGHEVAARYIASQFTLAGVKPAGENGGYLQSVNLLEATRSGPPGTVTLRTPRGAQTLTHGGAVMMRGPIAGGAVKLSAPLVFVGYGMQDATLGYDDYRDLDVRGKVAVILWGSPKGIDSEIGAHLQSEQGRVAAEHGAVATLYVATRPTAAAFPWEQVQQFAAAPPTTWVPKDGAPFDPSHGIGASARVDPKSAALLFEGAPKSLAQVLDEADADGGRPVGFPLVATADISVSTTTRRFSSPEVIGIVEGSDPKLKDEYVALMAHADHIGISENGGGDRINNGALDNAAGVAMLLEVGRAFATAERKPRRSILLVANTAEEKGLLGAEYFAHYPTVPIERITAAIDLDMPMLLYDFTDVVAYGATHSNLEAALRTAAETMKIAVSPDPMPEQAVFVRSDHYSMVKVGVPAVMLATGMANGGDAAWGRFLSTNYHQPSDDLSLPIIWSAGAKFADLNYRVVRALADAETPVRWYEGDYFGNLFAANATKVAKPAATQ
jgi:hypothetical protein